MHIRKKIRQRLIIGILVILYIIFYRGLKAETKNSFDCHLKVLYAVCTPKFKNAEFPGLWDIMKAGVKF